MSANTIGRANVLALTNKSGGAVAAGDVVIIDTANNDAFTTTTTANYTGALGVVLSTSIANNASGLVVLNGYVSLVNVNASVTRGHFGATFTVAKQATDGGASRAAGTFCQFLTGGTTPDAMIWQPDFGAGGTTVGTKGDIQTYTTVPANLGVGADSDVLTADHTTATGLKWAAPSGGAGDGNLLLYGWDSGTSSITGTWVWHTSSFGVAAPYVGYGWYNTTNAQNDQITWTRFLQAGTYTFLLRAIKYTDSGIVTVKIDGSSIGTIDLYNGSLAYAASAITGASVASSGSHTLQIILATKNAGSSGYTARCFDLALYRTA